MFVFRVRRAPNRSDPATRPTDGPGGNTGDSPARPRAVRKQTRVHRIFFLVQPTSDASMHQGRCGVDRATEMDNERETQKPKLLLVQMQSHTLTNTRTEALTPGILSREALGWFRVESKPAPGALV